MLPVRDPDMPLSARARARRRRSKPLGPSAYWGEEKIWDTQGQQPQLDDRPRRAASGSRRRSAGRTIPTSARRARIIRRPRCFRSTAADRQLAMYDPKTEKYTLHRHLLRLASSAVRLRRQRDAVDVERRRRRQWSAGSTPRCSTRPATPRSRRAGPRSSSTPTATASATSTPSPASRSIPTRTCASARRSTP